MAPPKDFVDLSAAYRSPLNSFVSIIGVVVDIREPTLAQSGEWMFTFKLLDDKIRDSLWGSSGLQVRFFKRHAHELPQIHKHGDVVLLRHIKIRDWRSQPMALSNIQTQVIVFPVESIPAPNYQIAYQDKKRLECLGIPLDLQKLTLQEQAYVIQLKQEILSTIQSLPDHTINHPTNASIAAQPVNITAATDNAGQVPANAPTGPAAMRKRPGEPLQGAEPKMVKISSFGKKFKTISEARARDFADLCVIVVKKFATQYGSCELYVTDYTPNKELFKHIPPEAKEDDTRDGDQYNYSGGGKKEWPGPYGHLVLQIEARSPHADYANREVNEGDLVMLQNVRLKTSAQGAGVLEGNMWQDSMNPEKVQIQKSIDKNRPEVQALFERMNRYWASREAKVGPKKVEEGKAKLTKTEKKKIKKQRQADKAANTKQARDASSPRPDEPGLKGKNKITINPHVRCGHQEFAVKTLTEIIDPENKLHTNTPPNGDPYIIPFVNQIYRARVRVVDFSPNTLEDFAIPKSQDDEDDDSVIMIDYDSSIKHQWSIALQLEDASRSSGSKDRLWATVGHAEAQYLFGNDIPDPRDLHEDRKLLAKVREKLCILWGNLEEKEEDEAVSNVPFECCLMEYGVDTSDEDEDDGFEGPAAALGWVRRYRMFGVTIS